METEQIEISREQFSEWLEHPGTKQFFKAVTAYREEIKNDLSVSAGVDQINDRYRAGVIAALNDILETKYE